MEHIVTGCADCAFCRWDSSYDAYVCYHPKREDEVNNFLSDMSPGGVPVWCPLVEEPITITKQ